MWWMQVDVGHSYKISKKHSYLIKLHRIIGQNVEAQGGGPSERAEDMGVGFSLIFGAQGLHHPHSPASSVH